MAFSEASKISIYASITYSNIPLMCAIRDTSIGHSFISVRLGNVQTHKHTHSCTHLFSLLFSSNATLTLDKLSLSISLSLFFTHMQYLLSPRRSCLYPPPSFCYPVLSLKEHSLETNWPDENYFRAKFASIIITFSVSRLKTKLPPSYFQKPNIS